MIEENKQFIKKVFQDVLEDVNSTELTYQKYFSKDYVQFVDGKKLNYDEFVSHMSILKSSLQSVKVNFKHIVAEDDKVFTIHTVHAIKKDGKTVKAQVHALFQIKDQKIILCDELTHITKGEKSDKDLGSRHS